MAIGCAQCPQTFRTQNGKTWHVQHIHADLPAQDSIAQGEGDDLSAIVENEITAQISDINSPLNIALDERASGVLAQVRQMIADSDQFLRAHVEHRIGERLQAITAIRGEPSRSVQVAEMRRSPSSFMKCSLNRHSRRSISPRPDPRLMRIATDEMIADALEYVARCKAEGGELVNYSDQGLTPVIPFPKAATARYDHRKIHDFVASLGAS